ncbi:hypothetical protein Ptr902_10700 [Pyrenophora tritici-repentis]|nr:hypothetical protein Ptr902_10700 [Pyrenophora tritici-repentis]
MAALSRIATILLFVAPFVAASPAPLSPYVPAGYESCFDPCISSFGFVQNSPCQKICTPTGGGLHVSFNGHCGSAPNNLCI